MPGGEGRAFRRGPGCNRRLTELLDLLEISEIQDSESWMSLITPMEPLHRRRKGATLPAFPGVSEFLIQIG